MAAFAESKPILVSLNADISKARPTHSMGDPEDDKKLAAWSGRPEQIHIARSLSLPNTDTGQPIPLRAFLPLRGATTASP
jgi:hypothetical protein